MTILTILGSAAGLLVLALMALAPALLDLPQRGPGPARRGSARPAPVVPRN